jgi:hypothetical protein
LLLVEQLQLISDSACKTLEEKLPTSFERQPSPLYFQSEAAKNIKTSLLQGLSPEKTSPFKP